MIVDVRTYTLVPRKMARYLELFESHALPVMLRHGLELMGYLREPYRSAQPGRAPLALRQPRRRGEEAREDVRIETAAVARGEAAVVAEALRRLGGGFVICQFGGLVVPDAGDLRPLASVLECPLFLVR